MASLKITALCANDDIQSLKLLPPRPQWEWTKILDQAAKVDAVSISKHCIDQGAKIAAGTIYAASKGQCPQVMAMLDARDIQIEQDFEIGDALTMAVYCNPDLVRFCLKHGSEPDKSFLKGLPHAVLGEAARDSTLDIVELLVKAGAKKEDSGALHFAAKKNRVNITRYLLQAGFDANELGPKDIMDARRDKDMGTPLHKAIEGGQAEIVELLIPKTDLSIRDGRGRTPVELASELDKTELVEKLQSKI